MFLEKQFLEFQGTYGLFAVVRITRSQIVIHLVATSHATSHLRPHRVCDDLPYSAHTTPPLIARFPIPPHFIFLFQSKFPVLGDENFCPPAVSNS